MAILDGIDYRKVLSTIFCRTRKKHKRFFVLRSVNEEQVWFDDPEDFDEVLKKETDGIRKDMQEIKNDLRELLESQKNYSK